MAAPQAEAAAAAGHRGARPAAVAADAGAADGGVALVAGTRVRGGIHGDWPGLADLDEGDVRTANDVRGVFAEVVDSVLGGDPERIVPGAPGDRLSLFR